MPEDVVVWTMKGARTALREERMLAEGVIGAGWEKLPSLSGVTSKEALSARVATGYPDMAPATHDHYVAQLWTLVDTMKEGDLLVLQVKTTATIAVGRISGPYQYRTDLGKDLQHLRPVQWIATGVPRRTFDRDLLHALDDFLTFDSVGRADTAARVLAVVADLD